VGYDLVLFDSTPLSDEKRLFCIQSDLETGFDKSERSLTGWIGTKTIKQPCRFHNPEEILLVGAVALANAGR
jgi:hypothetical protein